MSQQKSSEISGCTMRVPRSCSPGCSTRTLQALRRAICLDRNAEDLVDSQVVGFGSGVPWVGSLQSLLSHRFPHRGD